MLALTSALLLSLAAAPVTVQSLSTEYLDGLFRARPHLATFMGDHRQDGRVMDLSERGVRARVAELERLGRRVAALDAKSLSADERADARILQDGIALELFYLRDFKEWTWSPRLSDSLPFYDPREYVASRLSELIHGDFAPEPQRVRWLTQQLEALPRHLTEAQAALKEPSRVHLEQGIKDNAGRIEFFQTELKDFTQKHPDAEAARLRALSALEGFQRFLTAFPKERATHDWRLGAKLYAEKFPLALQTDLTPDELLARAQASFQQERARLYAIAVQLHRELFPKDPVPSAQASSKEQAEVIRRVKLELAKVHPRAEELVQAHADKLAGLRTFIEQKNLLQLPPADSLRVEPMPLFKRGATGAEYLAPGMLDTSSAWHGTFYVDPVDPTWPPDKVESYLRSNDTYGLTLTSAHEAYPGHHTQAWYARKKPNPLRSTLWSGAFAEGWAVYGEQLLVRQGLGGKENARYDFRETQSSMVVAANSVLDILLQTGRMTDAEALRFMEEDGFQEPALAEKKLLRAKLDSTQLCQYFLGLSEIQALEKDVKAAGNFRQREFDEALIGHGTVAVKVLRSFLLPAK